MFFIKKKRFFTLNRNLPKINNKTKNLFPQIK